MERQKTLKDINIPVINVDEFDYVLPVDRIPKYPLPERHSSKLLLYKDEEISEKRFSQIANFLPSKSLLVFNDSKVIHARLFFRKPTGASIEIFCLEPISPAEFSQNFSATKSVVWKCLVGNAKKWKSGTLTKPITINNQSFLLTAEKRQTVENNFLIRFSWSENISFGEIITEAGKIPIPPYLNRDSEPIDNSRYQTIYAQTDGSVAAPTAGLHFTDTIFEHLKHKNIDTGFVTLHVSAGTFKPVKSDFIAGHQMHREWIAVSIEMLEKLKTAETIFSVGTTSLRTLESLFWFGSEWIRTGEKPTLVSQWIPYQKNKLPTFHQVLDFLIEKLQKQKKDNLLFATELIIVPGYQFHVINGLITNFHQPRSTLLMLVAAIVGKHKWKEIYDFALKNNFRFLSYGDSSLLIPQVS